MRNSVMPYKATSRSGHLHAVGAQTLVIGHDVIRVQIEHRRAWKLRMHVDGLIHHQAAAMETEHRPSPLVVALVDTETELPVELDAGGHAAHR